MGGANAMKSFGNTRLHQQVNLLAIRPIKLLMDNAYTETQDNGICKFFKCSTCKCQASHFHTLYHTISTISHTCMPEARLSKVCHPFLLHYIHSYYIFSIYILPLLILAMSVLIISIYIYMPKELCTRTHATVLKKSGFT